MYASCRCLCSLVRKKWRDYCSAAYPDAGQIMMFLLVKNVIKSYWLTSRLSVCRKDFEPRRSFYELASSPISMLLSAFWLTASSTIRLVSLIVPQKTSLHSTKSILHHVLAHGTYSWNTSVVLAFLVILDVPSGGWALQYDFVDFLTLN